MKALTTTICALLWVTCLASAAPGTTVEGSDEKSTTFVDAFGFHDPMYFAVGEGTAAETDESVTFAKFQVSFLYELISLSPNRPADAVPTKYSVRIGIIAVTTVRVLDLPVYSRHLECATSL